MDELSGQGAEYVTYRGIAIKRTRPRVFLNKDRKKLALVTCSFSVEGNAMTAESIAKAHKLIDQVLGPP